MRDRINVSTIVDNSTIGRYQAGLFVLCAACLLMDGFDVQAVGYVAPAIVQEWQIPSYVLGSVFAAGNLGILIGSLVFSILADRVGRRPVLIGGTVAFSLLTLLTAQSGSSTQLLVYRFFAGLAMGSIMPNVVALVGEYSPRRLRVTMMMCVMSGFVIGASFGGFVSAWLIPHFGWRSVFYFGGFVPLAIAVLMYLFLPESIEFMVIRGRNSDQVRDALRRIDPAVDTGEQVEYIVAEEHRGGVPVAHLFREGRAWVTILIWIVNFMNLLDLYFLANWLPTVIRDAGYSMSNAVLVGTSFQVAGVAATFGFAWLMSRIGLFPVLIVGFVVACINIALIGPATMFLPTLFLTVFLAGLGIQGGQGGANALAATYYPTYMRSTGIGWSLGIGRVGAIVGPLIGGQLLRLQWSGTQLFVAAAIPALISSVVMMLLWRATTSPRAAPERSIA